MISFMDLLQENMEIKLTKRASIYPFCDRWCQKDEADYFDLLEYSRASKSIEEKEEVDLNEVLSEFKQLRRKNNFRKNQLKSSDLPIMYTYKVAIIQILHCLLDNALTRKQVLYQI
jgi:hypothetical protein